jgi:hypothetical protein
VCVCVGERGIVGLWDPKLLSVIVLVLVLVLVLVQLACWSGLQ